MELGLVIGALLFLLKPAARNFQIWRCHSGQKSHIALFVFNVARAFLLLIMFAVSLGNVTMVNA